MQFFTYFCSYICEQIQFFTQLSKYAMNLTTLPTEQLQSLLAQVRSELYSRKTIYDKREYAHPCGGKSTWHKKQHKHWAKKVDNITDHYNAMAFEGEWLSIWKPNEVITGDFILEFQGCKNAFVFFMAGKNYTIHGSAENFIDFRNQCIQYFKNPYHERYT